MKLALFALFLLCAFTSHLPSATADAVLDIDGEPLQNGGSYYILPTIVGNGGGLELATTGNETCPLSVVQSPFEVSNGLPLTISSPHFIAIINTGLILDIAFTAVPGCAQTPSKWTIVEELPVGWSVKITGYENALEGWFKIEKYLRESHDYKIVFCPRSGVTCGGIGIYFDADRKRRLVVNEENPLRVVFVKASSSLHEALTVKTLVLHI